MATDATFGNPQNKNFLSQTQWQMVIHRLSNLEFFIQKTNVPGLSLPSIATPTPFIVIPQPGDHIDLDMLTVEFKIDEDLGNWLEIRHWLRALGYPETFDQYADIALNPIWSLEQPKSDITIITMDSHRRPNFEFVYKDAFPTSLSGIQMDYTVEDITYYTATAQFKYTWFDVNRVKTGSVSEPAVDDLGDGGDDYSSDRTSGIDTRTG